MAGKSREDLAREYAAYEYLAFVPGNQFVAERSFVAGYDQGVLACIEALEDVGREESAELISERFGVK